MQNRALFTFILLYCLFCTPLLGQKPPIKFGKVSIEDLKMSTYENDSSAEAVILYDYGFFDGYNFKFTRILRIKILKKSGYKWADWTFSIRSSDNLKGQITNLEDGTIVKRKLNNSSIFEEKITQSYYITKVTFPNVQVGSVIDIQYTKTGIPPSWYFQYEIPVKTSELLMNKSDFISYKKHFYGNEKVNTIEENHWLAHNIPAIENEAYSFPLKNYCTKFEFEVTSINFNHFFHHSFATSWNAVNKSILDHPNFAAAIEGNLFLNKTAKEIKELDISQYEKIKLAYEAIKKVKWNDKTNLIPSPDLNSCYRNRIGSSSEINLLLLSLLRKINVSAYPVAISTRDNGFLPLFPSLSKFNSLIIVAYTFQGPVLLDATDKDLPMGLLPKRSINNNGRIIDEKIGDWIILEPKLKEKELTFYDISLDNDLTLNGNISHTKTDYAAYMDRKMINSYNSISEFVSNTETKNEGLYIHDYKIHNLDSIYQPLIENYNISIDNQVYKKGDKLYINPFLNEKINQNPFQKENRQTPINFTHPIEKTCVIKLSIPKGYDIEHLPKSIKLTLPEKGAEYLISVNRISNLINITSKFCINKTIFTQAEYADLRSFFIKTIEKQNDYIILKPIDNEY